MCAHRKFLATLSAMLGTSILDIIGVVSEYSINIKILKYIKIEY